jgi:hypothetical protein
MKRVKPLNTYNFRSHQVRASRSFKWISRHRCKVTYGDSNNNSYLSEICAGLVSVPDPVVGAAVAVVVVAAAAVGAAATGAALVVAGAAGGGSIDDGQCRFHSLLNGIRWRLR